VSLATINFLRTSVFLVRISLPPSFHLTKKSAFPDCQTLAVLRISLPYIQQQSGEKMTALIKDSKILVPLLLLQQGLLMFAFYVLG
jgi:hypothetical protein